MRRGSRQFTDLLARYTTGAARLPAAKSAFSRLTVPVLSADAAPAATVALLRLVPFPNPTRRNPRSRNGLNPEMSISTYPNMEPRDRIKTVLLTPRKRGRKPHSSAAARFPTLRKASKSPEKSYERPYCSRKSGRTTLALDAPRPVNIMTRDALRIILEFVICQVLLITDQFSLETSLLRLPSFLRRFDR